MPELPEVETTLRGIAPHVTSQKVKRVIVRQPMLRWPVPANLDDTLKNIKFSSASRRGKYLLLEAVTGTLMIHLGMSGKLSVTSSNEPPLKHDHIDIVFKDNTVIRYNDPRRFGSVHWTQQPEEHKLIRNLGPEPLSRAFNAKYLFELAKSRKTPIKTFLMNSKNVVGVGNIYANEALFLARIAPLRVAGDLTMAECETLTKTIKQVLRVAIQAGGTTLKDFSQPSGKLGYFVQQLQVYGRNQKACNVCGTTILMFKLGQRATYWCPSCQA